MQHVHKSDVPKFDNSVMNIERFLFDYIVNKNYETKLKSKN